MYKHRNDPKIYTGPVWDFDLGFNNDLRTYPVTRKSGNGYLWNCGSASSADGMIYFAQRILLKDPSTAGEILAVWKEARDNGLTAEWLQEKVDEYAGLLDESQHLNFIRWNILTSYVHMNPKVYGTYEAECAAVKDFIATQIPHLDEVIGYEAQKSDVKVVEAVERQESSPQYFTLTGVRIDKPEASGIYIELQAGKSRKIIVN